MKKCWSLSSAGGAVAPQQRTKSCCSSACLLACNACHTPSASSGHVRAVRQNRKMPKSSTAVGRQTVSHIIENIDISRISRFKINSNRKMKKLTPHLRRKFGRCRMRGGTNQDAGPGPPSIRRDISAFSSGCSNHNETGKKGGNSYKTNVAN